MFFKMFGIDILVIFLWYVWKFFNIVIVSGYFCFLEGVFFIKVISVKDSIVKYKDKYV